MINPNLPSKEDLERLKLALDMRLAEEKAADEHAKHVQETRQAEQKADSDRVKSAAEARSAEAKALADERDAMAKMLPDLSKVKESTLSVGHAEAPAALSTSALVMALDHVAEKLADDVAGALKGSARVLVTGEADLVSNDGVYQDVTSGLKRLIASADRLLADPSRDRDRGQSGGAELGNRSIAMFAGTVLTAAANLLPSALSLLSVQRSMTTGPVTVDDLAVTAAVMKALRHKETADQRIGLVHEPFRLMPESTVYEQDMRLSGKANDLRARQLELEVFPGQLMQAKAARDVLAKQLADAGDDQKQALATKLETAETEVAELTAAAAVATSRVAVISALVKFIDEYLQAIRVAPAGGRSPLAVAALQELLRAKGAKRITHVLLVKAHPSQAVQLTSNRSLWSRATFATLVDLALSFELLDVETSEMVRCGNISGRARVSGRIGTSDTDTFTLDRLEDLRPKAADVSRSGSRGA